MQCEIDELKKKLRRARRSAYRLSLNLLPRRQMMSHTGDDPELRLVKLSRATRNIVAINARIRAQRRKALETKP